MPSRSRPTPRNQRRPFCVRVCCRTRAVRRYAPPDRPAILRLGTATDVQSALVRPPRRLSDAEVSDAPRLPRCGRRGAYPDIVEQLLWCEPMLRGPRRSEDETRAGAKRGHRLADACVAGPCPLPSSTTTATRCPPHPPLCACAMTRAPAGGPA
ncbi:hypothetical protein EVAR_66759_1 [Eumeta japonica]|uniref:Uncharacterized protein n=1 Tax=Eumeta variegata TaxID=151549 RepID=A0A4C1Z5S0_EUMVA|nr:hypothetical protein EVAR_66759_1 [Eumeta japonica]